MNQVENPFGTFAVIGAGAVGAFYGASLARRQIPVEFQSAWAAKSLKSSKLKIQSVWGDFSLKANFHETTKNMKPVDVIIVSTKALPQIDYKGLLSPLFEYNPNQEKIIICLQNGINQEERLKKMFPRALIIGAVAFTCIYRKSSKKICHIDYGHIKMAPLEKKDFQLVKKLGELFTSCGIQCESTQDLKKLRWQKLLWNIPFNPLSVVLEGASTEDMMASPNILNLIQALMEETAQIAKSEGISITPKEIQEMILKTQKMKPYKTSMLFDHEQKKAIETEAILGEPLRIAKKNKIPTPKIEMLYELLSYKKA